MPTGVYRRSVTPEDRFWDYVKKTKTCWLWTGHIMRSGYGHFKWKGRTRTAHAVALEIRLGRALKPGFWALHRCPKNNRHCIRHVYEGTPSRNNGPDRRRDNTDNRGARQWMARLTESQVREILRAKRQNVGGAQARLARKFKVSPATVRFVWIRRTWRHVVA